MASERGRSSKRHRRNRRRFSAVFRLLFFGAVAAAVVLGCTVFFRVEDVVVSGNVRYTQEDIRQASGIQQGDNLFLLNKFSIQSSLEEKLPYIQEASIRRVLPDKILVEVTEWEAVAQIQDQAGNWWLLSYGGKLLEMGQRDGAMEISGLTPLAPSAGQMMAVSQEEQAKLTALKSLMETLYQRDTISLTSTIKITDGGVIWMRYDGRFDVKLMLSSDFNYRLKALETVVAEQEPGASGVMDLTQDVAVTYMPGESEG